MEANDDDDDIIGRIDWIDFVNDNDLSTDDDDDDDLNADTLLCIIIKQVLAKTHAILTKSIVMTITNNTATITIT